MQWVEGALLCGGLLASAVLAARSAAPRTAFWRDALCIAAGLGLMTLSLLPASHSATFSGLWLAGCAAWGLRPVAGPGLAIAAGSCAALAAAQAASFGMSWWLALPAAALAPLACGWLARRRQGFAPAATLDEALCGVASLALLLAAAGTVSRGWHTAVAMNRAVAEAEPGLAAPVWVWVAVATALAAGLARGVWKRR